jgi:hypothetical protein
MEFSPKQLERGRTIPILKTITEMSEDDFVKFGLLAGMKPFEIIAFLDNIRRWKQLGLGAIR